MDNSKRETSYRRQRNGNQLTITQQRRLRKKANKQKGQASEAENMVSDSAAVGDTAASQ